MRNDVCPAGEHVCGGWPGLAKERRFGSCAGSGSNMAGGGGTVPRPATPRNSPLPPIRRPGAARRCPYVRVRPHTAASVTIARVTRAPHPDTRQRHTHVSRHVRDHVTQARDHVTASRSHVLRACPTSIINCVLVVNTYTLKAHPRNISCLCGSYLCV